MGAVRESRPSLRKLQLPSADGEGVSKGPCYRVGGEAARRGWGGRPSRYLVRVGARRQWVAPRAAQASRSNMRGSCRPALILVRHRQGNLDFPVSTTDPAIHPQEKGRLARNRPYLFSLIPRLGDLCQDWGATATHCEADSAEAKEHHRPGARLRDGLPDGDAAAERAGAGIVAVDRQRVGARRPA